MIALVLALAVQAEPAELAGVRTPAVAVDGRIAVTVRGDLWVIGDSVGPVRITDGPAWDRDPAWTRDGRALVFSSDRDGVPALWRVDLEESGDWSPPVRLTSSSVPETEPALMTDGTVIFVRGVAGAADLWSLLPDGTERRLTDEPGADRSPAVSVTGAVAYVAERDGGASVRVRESGGRDRELVTDVVPTRLSWSPDGQRLAFGSRGRQPGLWVADADGDWSIIASEQAGDPAWLPGADWLLVAQPYPAGVGYNGDPDRLSGRVGGDVLAGSGGLRRVRAPLPPDDGVPVEATFRVARAGYNADAFDRVWNRVARLYFGWNGSASDTARTPQLAAWRDAARRHRPAALSARTQAELDSAIERLLSDRPAARQAARGRAAVSSAHPLATAAGVEILEAGGNVVDAAVAVSFALGVVEPDASGIGGYGVALIHLQGMEEPTSIEFMTRVPEAATPDNLLMRELPPEGPRRVNVPGTVAGMALAWERYGSGRIPWARLLEPAIRIAERGFSIDDAFATTLSREWVAFARSEAARALFFPGDRPLEPGDTLRNPDLAATLRAIADGGADVFYRGSVAERIVADLSAAGNPIALTDMSGYSAVERRPVRTTYRGHAVYSGPPPVTGGVSLVGKLNLLELADPGRSIVSDASTLHAMIEAWKLLPSTGGRVADPDMFPTDVSPFESKDTARARWACFDPARARSGPLPQDVRECAAGTGAPTARSPAPGPGVPVEPCAQTGEPGCRSAGTTAFAVADADGNAVSVTQTLGTWGGNFHVTPGLGFLYNDKLTAGRRGGRGGSVPLARIGTVIAPTLVFDGNGPGMRPLLAVGGAGNAWITSAVYEVVVGVLDHGLGPQQALELPRFLPSGRGGPVQIEDSFSPAALRQLEAMGHEFRPISLRGELRMGYGAAILLGDGEVTAGADPRRSGAAAAVR